MITTGRRLLWTLPLLASFLPAIAASTVSLWNPLPYAFDKGGGSGLDVVAPVSLSPADGVNSLELAFQYDPTLLTALGVYRTGYTSGFSMMSDLSAPGTVRLSMDRVTPLSGSGEVAWVVFRVLGTPGLPNALHWTSAVLNHGTIAALQQDGQVPVLTASAIFSIPDGASGRPGASVTVPISVSPVSGVTAIDLKLVFDSTVLTAASAAKTTLTAPMALTSNLTRPGEVLISLFTDGAGIAGSGPVAQVTFHVLGLAGDRAPLDLRRGDLDEGSVTTLLDDGEFRTCDDLDRDGDGLAGCVGDCDDQRASVHPGAPELCDGLDNDCDRFIDEGATLTFFRDADSDDYGTVPDTRRGCTPPEGYVADAGDCDDLDPYVHPGAPERCNGRDDDCDGSVDEQFAPPSGIPHLDVAGPTPAAWLSWNSVGGSTGCDVARGSLAMLRSSGGDFSQATLGCLADNRQTPNLDDPDPAPAGAGFWYLARAVNCATPGSWDSGGSSQQGGRNAEMAASPVACP